MLNDEIGALLKALNNLQNSASFGEKYGPYFFAVALLIVTPFVCRVIFAGSLGSADPAVRQDALKEFRFYFRSTVAVGIICVLAGVGWWPYDSYRESARTLATVTQLKAKLEKFDAQMKTMNFAAYGVISAGIQPEDVFYETLINPQMSIVFANLPAKVRNSQASWFFVILSNRQLPPVLDFNVGWSTHDGNGVPTGQIQFVPTRIQLAKKYGYYKFSFGERAAIIQPLPN